MILLNLCYVTNCPKHSNPPPTLKISRTQTYKNRRKDTRSPASFPIAAQGAKTQRTLAEFFRPQMQGARPGQMVSLVTSSITAMGRSAELLPLTNKLVRMRDAPGRRLQPQALLLSHPLGRASSVLQPPLLLLSAMLSIMTTRDASIQVSSDIYMCAIVRSVPL